MGVTWTEEQKKVIELRDRNILVSAAAGSGKTAVLVERIIARLTREDPPLSVDQLLIMTFTEAAASEMKERIGTAIEVALEKDPQNEHLKKQSVLIHTAKIMTIHSFCSSVIRDHFHTIDLDPGFRVAEEGELTLLKQEVMKELLEEHYEKASEKFLKFVETFSTGRDDSELEDYIFKVYEFAQSNPIPELWLDESIRIYETGMEKELCEKVLSYVRKCLQDIETDMKWASQICNDFSGPYMYRETIETDLYYLQDLLQASTYEEFYQGFHNRLKWERMAANKDPLVDKELADYVKELRGDWKEKIVELKKQFFFQNAESMELDLKLCYPVVSVLIELTKEFGERFAKKKAERNVIDFNDMEHFAIRILTQNENGKLVPSDVAKEYQDTFEEVMVDEYQDSNLVQETIMNSVSRVSCGEYNIFMVGDVKQSIYRFRLSRPELFVEKYDTYTLEPSTCQRVDLHKNFRSRAEVLDFANEIFFRIMRKEVGNVLYDQQAALHVGAFYEPTEGNEAEILIIDTEVEEELRGNGQPNARELEAKVIAEKIHDLMKTQKVWDKAKGNMRAIQYGDIVILTRSLKGWADVFVKVLKQEGIPAYTDSKEGYFGTLEIGWMMDYLRVLDNFRQDIPLASVMKSPFGKFTNEELAQIRIRAIDRPFYEAVLEIAKTEKEERTVLEKKVQTMYEKISSFRQRISYTSIHDLLWEIMEETGYFQEISAMPGGEQRAANLELLIVKAKGFESTSYKGLFHFVRYIEQIREYDIDYGEAEIQGEAAHAVRVLSIHKSKGLEFPVVIVAGMGKGFNMQDVSGNLVIHPELGIGVRAVDTQKRTAVTTILRNLIQTETQIENLGEELRVLYVALTRAKEKLILTGTLKKAEEKLRKYGRRMEESPLTFLELLSGKRYFDWVLPVVLGSRNLKSVKLSVRTIEDIVQGEMEREIEERELLLERRNTSYEQELANQFQYCYPYADEESVKLKYTVSELKKQSQFEADEMETGEMLLAEEEKCVPEFLKQEEHLTGASRGSVYHKVLELLDFSKTYEEDTLKDALTELGEKCFLSAQEIGCVWRKDIHHFLNSNVGKRMCMAAKCGKLQKEQPFVFGIDARELHLNVQREEMILIQGIIDVYFEENEELVVVDYKTDRVQKEEELVERYREQLDLYARALEQLTQKKVKEKIIYSFTLEKEIRWT